ncbi:MAG: hypothetical protein JNL38_05190 [Myxococcales bacterium]|nr:hypothetical protein [Myxococcales bacterium]
MRRRTWLIVTAAGALFAAAGFVVACDGDLLHSTAFETSCSFDASACATDAGATPETSAEAGGGPVDLCAIADPKSEAARACAWLGSCMGPLGGNAFADCMFQSLQVIDCKARPEAQAKGASKTYWQCLVGAARAESCDAVRRCVVPAGDQECANPSTQPYTACLDFKDNVATRFVCPPNGGKPQFAESCAGQARTCQRTTPGTAFCVPSATTGVSCDAGCEGTKLHTCNSAGDRDLGVDCTQLGGGACVSTGVVPACQTDPADSCSPSADVVCDGEVAKACFTGKRDSVDCARLGSTCNPSTTDPKGDVTRGCSKASPCADDACNGTKLTSCTGGVTYTTDCAALGFTKCEKVSIFGEGVRAACAK